MGQAEACRRRWGARHKKVCACVREEGARAGATCWRKLFKSRLEIAAVCVPALCEFALWGVVRAVGILLDARCPLRWSAFASSAATDTPEAAWGRVHRGRFVEVRGLWSVLVQVSGAGAPWGFCGPFDFR